MSLWHSVLARTPALALMRRQSAGFGRVLMYHRVLPDDCDPLTRRLLVGAVTRSKFERQLDYLGRHFQVVSLRELVARRDSCGRLVAITFDDGYADNLWHALPALQERGMPATVFVTSSYLDSSEGVWWERLARWVVQSGRATMRLDTGDRTQEFPYPGRPTQQFRNVRKFLTDLTPEARKAALAEVPTHPQDRFLTTTEMRQLAAAGVQIEGHTVTHPRLSSLSREQVRREVAENKHTLEERLGHTVEFMAYPYGDRDDFDTVSMEVAREAGYRAAFAAYRGLVGPDTELFAIPRIATRQEFDRFRVATARTYPTR